MRDRNGIGGVVAARTLGGALCVGAVLCSGCNLFPETRRASERRSPSVLVVVLDACRADKIGAYSFDRPTTPRLDALTREDETVVFRHYYVQAPWTKTSTASLFTGLFPYQHGLLSGDARDRDGARGRVYATQSLVPAFDTMAECLSRAGFATFAVVKSHHLDARYGFDQGFERFRFLRGQDDEELVRETLREIERARGAFFGYVHLYACHNPFREEERDADYMRRFGFPYDEAGRASAGIDFARPEIKFAIREGKIRLTPEDERFLHLVYEAKLRQVDERLVGPLVTGLRNAGRYDDLLLIVTADHGEALFEHEAYAHSGLLWNTVLHVPLIVKFPKGARPSELAREVRGTARAVDLLPSLLSWVGQPPPPYLPGVDLFRGATADFTLAEVPGGWTLQREGYKLIRFPERRLLFHVAEDPGELRDLAFERPSQADALESFARALFRNRSRDLPLAVDTETELDPATEDELRSLGYIP